MMSDEAATASAQPKRRFRIVLLPLMALFLGGAGFAVTYLGLLSGFSVNAAHKGTASAASLVQFVDVPKVEVPLPDGRHRTVTLSATIETTKAARAEVEHLMPRVLDSFTSFLADIDPAAYGKRGILEIIRAEMVTRSRNVLGEDPVKDLLITEFRIK